MLDDLQVQLEAHFAALSTLRRPAGYPVYPIEHGLGSGPLQAIFTAAARHRRTYGLHRKHWLVWVVVGAEAGYRYDGEEYWPELETLSGAPWSQAERRTLRRWFELFHRQFGSLVPEGRWAQQFSIIAWPIAGALLPRYLQGHFARHLYEVRYGLSRLADYSALEIGNYLAQTSDERSTRYDDFLEQTDLTGRIVLALRDEDLSEPVPRIAPATLNRVVADLERRRDAGEFLRAARQVLRSARGVAAASLTPFAKTPTSKTAEDDQIKPLRLVVRRNAEGRSQIGVRIPDFSGALRKAGATPTALARLRVRLAGETERWSPGAALLSWSNLDLPLKAMPDPGHPVIELDQMPPALGTVLNPLLSLQERPVWLTRREQDGVYRQVAGTHVRPDQVYVAVLRATVPEDVRRALALSPSPTGLDGLSAYSFRTPPTVSAAYRAALQTLGLGYALRARVEPAGLSPVLNPHFDGPSWAVGEEVILRLTADFQAAEFILQLDGAGRKRFAVADGATFVTLGSVGIGRHTLQVSAIAREGAANTDVDASPIAFDFAVFEPKPWVEVAAGRAGFRVLMEPADASLEQLLTGQAQVSVYGPPGRRAAWRIETINASGHVASGGTLVQVVLPMEPSGFNPALRRLKDYSDAIDTAHRVDLVAELGELGRQAVRFPHQVQPLRWVLDQGQRVRLIDETAHDEAVRVIRLDLATPAIRQKLETDATAGVALSPPGALYSAKYKGKRYTAFASWPAAGRLNALSDLGLAQDCRPEASEPTKAIVALINALQLWRTARPIGAMALVRKTQTIVGLEFELCGAVCGADWAALLTPPGSERLERAQAKVGGSPGWGVRMKAPTWSPTSWGQAREAFFQYADRYGVCSDRSLTDQALCLAFRPWALRFPAEVNVQEALAALTLNRPLVRGAFLARAALPRTTGALAA